MALVWVNIEKILDFRILILDSKFFGVCSKIYLVRFFATAFVAKFFELSFLLHGASMFLL